MSATAEFEMEGKLGPTTSVCEIEGSDIEGQGQSPKMADVNEDQREETKYDGCEGPDSKYIKLISSDKHEFIIRRDYAVETSPTIKNMLSGPGECGENETNEVNFKEIPSHILQQVCQYFIYKGRYTNSSAEIPSFPIKPDFALELIMAANFLEC